MIHLKLFLCSAFVFFFALSAAAKGQFESIDFSFTEAVANETAKKCGIDKTLVVFDIDNTLLTTKQDLGGDAWFNWQAGIIAKGGDPQAAAADFDSLLKLQGTLFSLSGMRVADDKNPGVVKRLQQTGFPMIALTSRGYGFRDATLRELKANGYELGKTAIGPQGGFASEYTPYDLVDVTRTGLTADEATRFKLGKPREVMYQDGVFFGSGQHKGAMLKTLLHRIGYVPCGIVFTDDTPSNVTKLWDAYESSTVDVTVIRYGKLDADAQAFSTGDKSAVVDALKKLLTVLGEVFH